MNFMTFIADNLIVLCKLSCADYLDRKTVRVYEDEYWIKILFYSSQEQIQRG